MLLAAAVVRTKRCSRCDTKVRVGETHTCLVKAVKTNDETEAFEHSYSMAVGKDFSFSQDTLENPCAIMHLGSPLEAACKAMCNRLMGNVFGNGWKQAVRHNEQFRVTLTLDLTKR
jgi:hypothetical protein